MCHSVLDVIATDSHSSETIITDCSFTGTLVMSTIPTWGVVTAMVQWICAAVAMTWNLIEFNVHSIYTCPIDQVCSWLCLETFLVLQPILLMFYFGFCLDLAIELSRLNFIFISSSNVLVPEFQFATGALLGSVVYKRAPCWLDLQAFCVQLGFFLRASACLDLGISNCVACNVSKLKFWQLQWQLAFA